jgi:ribosome biogenesis GTPase / thiamine phosphate phosphatase
MKDQSTVQGTVIRIDAGQSHVDTPLGVLRCVLRGRLTGERPGARSKGPRAPATEAALAVGDQVEVLVTAEGQGAIEQVLPRRTKLSRRAVGSSKREQIVAANVDQMVIVTAASAPSLNLIDRYLVAASRGGLQPVICINKIDLGIPAGLAGDLAPYTELDYPVHWTSAVTGAGIPEFRAQLAQVTSVLAGKSGVGKSALLTAVDPQLALRSAPISEATGKGRHTTSFSSLLPLAGGGYVIDTPGIREYTLWEIEPRDLDQHFPDIAQFAAECRFDDCAHRQEPDCGVKAALADGRLPERRYASYSRIRNGLDDEALD